VSRGHRVRGEGVVAVGSAKRHASQIAKRGGGGQIDVICGGRPVVRVGVVNVIVTDGPNTVLLTPAALCGAAGSPVSCACPLRFTMQEDGLAIITTVPDIAVSPNSTQGPNPIATARQDSSLVGTWSTQTVLYSRRSHIAPRSAHESTVGDGSCLRRGLEGLR
jgi:hypothetical protein